MIDVIKDIIAGKFHGGLLELGLAEHGVGFVSDERNKLMLPIDVVEKVNKLRDEIIAGAIKVPYQ